MAPAMSELTPSPATARIDTLDKPAVGSEEWGRVTSMAVGSFQRGSLITIRAVGATAEDKKDGSTVDEMLVVAPTDVTGDADMAGWACNHAQPNNTTALKTRRWRISGKLEISANHSTIF
jgi:hypothetical protein